MERNKFNAIDRMAESLFVYCDMRSREYEGVELFRLALDRLAPHHGEDPHPMRVRLLLLWYDLLIQSKGRPKGIQEIKEIQEHQENLKLLIKKNGNQKQV